MKKIYKHSELFITELGSKIEGLEIAYHTYGTLNKEKSNVVWVCHALTANSDVFDWWNGLFGDNKLFNPDNYFIVCANIIGSCYGTTGPLSVNKETQKPYLIDFPLITVRDLANAHILLKNHLGINKIKIGIGGSLGGYQLLEWSVIEPDTIENLILMVTSAKESAWGVGIHTAQRMALEADCNFCSGTENGGKKGLITARAIGMLTYRNYNIFNKKQSEPEINTVDNFAATSYLNYQGKKLADRFNSYSYYSLTKTMDTHNLARNRNKSMESVLGSICSKTLVIGITSDILCPVDEQKYLAANIPGAIYSEIDSPYGHDGFLIEFEKLEKIISDFINKN
jgi:homoserine O-acetyltransferase/O-succinyltransferase